MAWRTWWELSWDHHPRAVGYEVRAVTTEGPARELARRDDRLLRVEAAAGDDPAGDQPARRDLLLALQQGQLAYQVRVVAPGPTTGAWSPALAVGRQH